MSLQSSKMPLVLEEGGGTTLGLINNLCFGCNYAKHVNIVLVDRDSISAWTSKYPSWPPSCCYFMAGKYDSIFRRSWSGLLAAVSLLASLMVSSGITFRAKCLIRSFTRARSYPIPLTVTLSIVTSSHGTRLLQCFHIAPSNHDPG
jgi:hypothetical protein